MESCPDCGSANLAEETREGEFQLGDRNPVTLTASAPVCICRDCGCMIADWRMERARNLAVSAWLRKQAGDRGIPEPYLTAHAYSSHHRKQLDHFGWAACFYCLERLPVAAITDWIDEEQTALCPRCGIDAVLPASNEITLEFLNAMQSYWFATPVKTLFHGNCVDRPADPV